LVFPLIVSTLGCKLPSWIES